MTNKIRLFRKKKEKRKLTGLDKYVIFSIGALIIYTIISLFILIFRGFTADTLTACFFAFFGGEIVTCALIKIFKLKENNPKTDSQFDEEAKG